MQTSPGMPPSPALAPLAQRSLLVIQAVDRAYSVQPEEAPILIGRDVTARVCIDDERISRIHVRVEHTPTGWVAVDHSRNGIWLGGTQQSQVAITGTTTIHLGHPHGIPVTFTEGSSAPPHDTGTDTDDAEATMVTEITDPGIARAGAAVAARRKELDLPQRYFGSNGIMSAGTLIDFEKGRRWPRRATRAKLEEVLGWPPGHIAAIRYQRASPSDEQTVALTNAARAPLMTEVVEVALSSISDAIKSLPPTTDCEFTARASRILADLRRIEASTARAARAATGDPSIARMLGSVRKTYKDLMLLAARAPGASLGQRLFAARHHAELSPEEVANAAGVPVEVINAAEAEGPLDAGAVAAVSAALSALSDR